MMNEQRQRFAENYVRLGNGTKAAIESGYAESGAHVTASRLLKDDKVMEAITNLRQARQDDMRVKFLSHTEEVLTGMMKMFRDEEISPQTRYNIGKDLLDRSGFKPSDKVEHSGGQHIEVTDAKETILQRLNTIHGQRIETKAD